MSELWDDIKEAHDMFPKIQYWYRIENTMTRAELLALKPRGAKGVLLLPDGDKYKVHEYLAHDVVMFVGIAGKVKFI